MTYNIIPEHIRFLDACIFASTVKILWRTLGSRVSPTVGEKLPKRLGEGKVSLGRVPEPQMTLHLRLCPVS